jgi:acyl-coenzyme A synthetase/AMP-(fatty) acid ligase
LEQEVADFAAGLAARGVRAGECVALALDNSIEACVAILGCLRLGAVFVCLNPTIKEDKLRALLEHSTAVAFITDVPHLELMQGGRGYMPNLCVVVGADAAADTLGYGELLETDGGSRPVALASSAPAELAAIIYTSGTTGQPKGVMHSRGSLASVSAKIGTYLEVRSSDVILSVLPLSFGYGLTQLLVAVQTGACLVLERRMGYPAAFLGQIARRGVTIVPVVPTISAMLLRLNLTKFDLGSLRVITSAGAHLPAEQARRWRAALPEIHLYNMYGQTECIRASYLHPLDADDHPGTIGRGLAGQEWGLIQADGRPAAVGEVGELVLASDHMMLGYWEDPERTARVLRSNPLPEGAYSRAVYTGDLFRSDGEGYLSFVARRDDMLNSRGELVSPREVEDVIAEFPGISEVAVYGSPDEVLGTAIWASVVVDVSRAPSEAEVMRHCAAHLEDHMIPSGLEFRDDLPRTPNGKIARAELSRAREAMR